MTWFVPFLWSVLLLQAAKDPISDQILEFKKYYKPTRTVHEKVEAIHVLDKLDKVSATELLLDASMDPQFPVRQAAFEVLGAYKSPEVTELLRKVAGEEKGAKSGRRCGAIEALGRIGDTSAVPILVTALEKGDFELKRSSAVALGRIRAPEAVAPLARFLPTAEPPLQTAALDALAAIGKPDGCVAAILPLLESAEWQVRSSAIQCLGKLRVKEAIEPLIERLKKDEGRMREEAMFALQKTTGFEYEDDAGQWQRWWDNVKATFVVPTDAELAKRKAAKASANQVYANNDKKTIDFAGVKTKSRHVLFIIDVSGSMEDLIAEPKNFKLKDRAYRSFIKIEIVKDELCRTVDNLEPNVRFDILTFATDVKFWKGTLIAANIVNKSAAKEFISRLKPIGGASQNYKAGAGLSGSAGLAGGKTNTYGALMAAFDAGNASAGYDKRYTSDIDTMFFLSDGTPSTGDYVEKDDILAEVRRVNSLRKIVINTIAIGEMDQALMTQLASQNGGTFTDLGK
jgi:Mg-chelatase subunit ChlD